MPKVDFSSKKPQVGFTSSEKQPLAKGFTLIELLIVVAIIGITVAIGAITYSGAQRQSRNAKRQSDLKKIASVLEQFYSDTKEYPSDQIQMKNCLEGTSPCTLSPGGPSLPSPLVVYLQKIPTDPLGGSYTYTPAKAVHKNPSDSLSACTYQKFTLTTSSADGTVTPVTDPSAFSADPTCP